MTIDQYLTSSWAVLTVLLLDLPLTALIVMIVNHTDPDDEEVYREPGRDVPTWVE